MALGRRNKAPTRDMHLPTSGAGKGDADRSDPKKFRARMLLVAFPLRTNEELGFRKVGGKLVKRYGPAAKQEIEFHAAPPFQSEQSLPPYRGTEYLMDKGS